MTTTRWVLTVGPAALALLPACAHSNESPELTAQTGSDLSRSYENYSESAPLPPKEAQTIGGGDAGAAPLADHTGDVNGSATASYTSTSPAAPECPLTCYVAEGRQRDPLRAETLDLMRGALGPIMAGLRQCMSASWNRHRPTVNLRFSYSGDLMDLGVDSTGFDANVEDCMQHVARGTVSNPSVKFDGPATVRCTEKCERTPPTRRTRGPR